MPLNYSVWINSFHLLEEQNVQQYGTVWTTDDHLPIVSSVVENLAVKIEDSGLYSFFFSIYFINWDLGLGLA